MRVYLQAYQEDDPDGVDGQTSIERNNVMTLDDMAEVFLTFLHANGFSYVQGVAIDRGEKYPLVWSPS